MFATLWHRALSRQAAPPHLIIVITAVIALVAVLIRRIWRIARNAITIAHEGGHALAALLSGRKLQSIRLRADTSGLTVTKGRPTGLGMFLTLVAGYISPSLVGLGGAWLLSERKITVSLWLCIVLLLGVLLMIRNAYGFVAVLITGAVVFGVSWFAGSRTQAAFAYAGVWFLLIGGVRPVFEIIRQRSRGEAPDSDADQLARFTHVPGLLWCAVFLVVSVGALVAGAALMGLVPATLR